MGRLEGDLSVMPLSDVVIWLANRRSSGRLIIEQETIRKEFVVDQATATYGTTNDPREYFGQFLMHLGLITDNQLSRAYGAQKEASVLLGRILVMIGIVPEEQVIQTLRIKIAESMLDAFQWRWGWFRFEDVPVHEPRPKINVAIPLLDLHREGIARLNMWENFRKIFQQPTQPLEVNEHILAKISPLEGLEQQVVDLARNGLGMESITLELHATDYQVASRLMDLHHRGIVNPVHNHQKRLISDTHSLDYMTDARAALDNGNYANALKLVQKGASLDPSNHAYSDLRREVEARAIESSEPKYTSKVPIKRSRIENAELMNLNARERYILGRVDGIRTISSILQLSPMHDLEAQDILRRLERFGLVEFRSKTP